MAFIPAPAGTVRTVFRYDLKGQECINVVYFDYGVAPLAADLQALNTSLENDWTSGVAGPMGFCSGELTLIDITSTAVATNAGITETLASGAVGSAGGEPIANSLASVCSFRTGLAGRSQRGRIYIPGIAQGQLLATDLNRLQTTAATGLQTAVETALTGTVPTHVVASYYSGVDGSGNPIPRALAVLTPVTSYQVNPRLDQQRRRMPRS